MKHLLSFVALATLGGACGASPGGTHNAEWIGDTASYGKTPVSIAPATPPPAPSSSLVARYRDVAGTIIAKAHADRGAYTKLAELTDHIGHRLAGSPELDRAIAWATQALKADGHDARTEKVMVPHWVRGAEDAKLLTPVARPLPVIGLGGTVPTPKGGITAPVVVIRSFDELEAKAASVKGAIVLFDVPMPPWDETQGNYGYGIAVAYRTKGPSRAAKLGAVGVLMRSVTPHSLHTLHTGALSYDPALPKIPAAAVTVEDSALIARLAEAGPVSVHLHLESKMLPDAVSANVIGELRGKDLPDEVVVIGGHLDSWDVGQGAHDDGTGVVTMMQAITVLRQLGLQPRRTIRVVLFTNEENGVRGAKAYAADHAGELGNTILAVESDGGGFSPRGFSLDAKPEILEPTATKLREIMQLLAPLHAMKIDTGYAGTDVSPMIAGGVPALELMTDNRTYFDIHHTDADTLDKVDPQQLADDVAAVAVLAYVVADMPDRLAPPPR